MTVLKFRIYVEEDNGIYRDIVVKITQSFKELHLGVLNAYGFDQKHQATFYRSNEAWQRGREISLEKYEKPYRAEPLLMDKTIISTEIHNTNQRFVYEYDFDKNWIFMLELIGVSKEDDKKATYPYISRVEGVGPQQYGTNNILANQFIDVEEKYDLNKDSDGFGHEGDSAEETDGAENDEQLDAEDDY